MPVAIPIVAAVAGGLIAANASKKAAQTAADAQTANTNATIAAEKDATKLDPRIDNIIYGDGSNPNGGGLVGRINGLLDRPINSATANFNSGIGSYINDWGTDNFMHSQQAAQRLQDSHVQAPTLNAPNQNDINLSPAYQSMIYGDAGANPYLNQSLQSGIDQTNASYQKNQTDLTDNLLRNVLPSLRSNSILTGQYGGSREGIAEGNALGDFTKQLNNSNLQLALGNSANTTGAQATSFNQGQDRSLSALQGLSGQQYGKSQADMQAQLQTNQLNSQNQVAGTGLSSGLLNTAVGYNQNANNTDIANLSAVSGLLQPYAGKGSPISVPTYAPTYSNTAGSALGGATAALGLYNSFQKPSNDPYMVNGTNTGVNADYASNPLFNTSNYAR